MSSEKAPTFERVKSQVAETVTKLPIPHGTDRRLFLIFWFICGCGAFVYFIFCAIKCADAYKTPGASIEVDPVQPPLPVYGICFESGFGDSDYGSDPYYAWEDGTGHAPNVLPVATAYWNFSGDPMMFYERFRYFTEEIQSYCNYGCDCIQTNMYNELKTNKGNVEIYASGNYNVSADRSVAYLFIRPQELGRFTNGTSGENYDNLNLPSGSHVDASWTVSKRVTTTKWVPYTEKTDISYGMTQQVEPLTKTATVALIKGLSPEKAVAVCENLAANATCSLISGFTGSCFSGVCSWNCPLNTTTYIPLSWLCDGYYDCPQGEDEITSNCPQPFVCSDGKSIQPESRCNGVVDCKDAGDEYNCTDLPIAVSVTVAPYVSDVTLIKSAVTFGWDVALAAFKSVLELAIAAMAFLFPSYFLAEPELRRFIWRKPEKDRKPSSPEGAETPLKSINSPEPEKATVEMKSLEADHRDQDE